MKSASFLVVAAAAFGISSASAQTLALSAPSAVVEAPTAKAAIQWRSTQHNFGEIIQSVPATATFAFQNSGRLPVQLTQVQGSCGCTATEYPKEPVQPGQSAVIKATFNAANLGSFNKTITVTTTGGITPQVLTLQGSVVAAR